MSLETHMRDKQYSTSTSNPLRLCKTLCSPHMLTRGGRMCSLAHPSSRTTRSFEPQCCTIQAAYKPKLIAAACDRYLHARTSSCFSSSRRFDDAVTMPTICRRAHRLAKSRAHRTSWPRPQRNCAESFIQSSTRRARGHGRPPRPWERSKAVG